MPRCQEPSSDSSPVTAIRLFAILSSSEKLPELTPQVGAAESARMPAHFSRQYGNERVVLHRHEGALTGPRLDQALAGKPLDPRPDRLFRDASYRSRSSSSVGSWQPRPIPRSRFCFRRSSAICWYIGCSAILLFSPPLASTAVAKFNREKPTFPPDTFPVT